MKTSANRGSAAQDLVAADAGPAELQAAEQVRSLQILCSGMVFGVAVLLPQNQPILASVMPGAQAEEVGVVMARCAAAGSLTEFILNPLLGSLADSIGRRPILLGALLSTSVLRAVAYSRRRSLRAISINMILTRGLDTVVFTTVRAALADMLSGQALSEAAPRIATAAGVTVMLAPPVSLALTRLTGSHTLPLLVASATSLAAAAAVIFRLRETVTEARRKPFSLRMASPFAFIEVLTSSVSMCKLMTTSALQTMIDGRNVADTDFAYQQAELGWSAEDSGRFVAAAGLKILLGGIIGKALVKKMGVRGIGSFSNAANVITALSYFAVPSWSMYVLFLGMFGDRKRDGVESMANTIGTNCGFGKGRISAALFNWRSIANMAAPLVFSVALSFGIRMKNATGIAAASRLHYLVCAMVSVLAELVYRSIGEDELNNALRRTEEKEKDTMKE